MFVHRLALEIGEPDVDALKARIPHRMMKRWFAYYILEPWGQSWLRSGREVSLIRAALTGRFDKHDEERFLVTYQPGREYRSAIPPTDEEIAERLMRLPGMRAEERPKWQRSEKSGQSLRRRPPGS